MYINQTGKNHMNRVPPTRFPQIYEIKIKARGGARSLMKRLMDGRNIAETDEMSNSKTSTS